MSLNDFVSEYFTKVQATVAILHLNIDTL